RARDSTLLVDKALRHWVPIAAALGLALAAGFFWGQRSSARTVLRPSTGDVGRRAAATIPAQLAPQRLRGAQAADVAPAPSTAAAEASPGLADDADTEPTLTAEQERQQQLTKLRESGRDERNLLGTVLSAFGDWHKKLEEAKLDVKLGQWSCFRGGCYMDAVHPSLASVSDATAAITTTDSF